MGPVGRSAWVSPPSLVPLGNFKLGLNSRLRQITCGTVGSAWIDHPPCLASATHSPRTLGKLFHFGSCSREVGMMLIKFEDHCMGMWVIDPLACVGTCPLQLAVTLLSGCLGREKASLGLELRLFTSALWRPRPAGATLCVAGCSAVFLTSTHRMPVAPIYMSPPVMTRKNVSRHYQMSLWRQNHPHLTPLPLG